MAAGDVYELVHEMAYEGQQLLNVYFFQNISGAEGAQDIADQYVVDRVPDIRLRTTDLVDFILVRARNIFNDADVGETALSGTGALATASEDFPSFVAASFRMEHNAGNVRPGFKRIFLQTENAQDEGVWNTPTLDGFQSGIADPLVNPLDWAPDWTHVVVGRILDAGSYRLPESQAELTAGEVSTVTALVNVTTQNSRKWYT